MILNKRKKIMDHLKCQRRILETTWNSHTLLRDRSRELYLQICHLSLNQNNIWVTSLQHGAEVKKAVTKARMVSAPGPDKVSYRLYTNTSRWDSPWNKWRCHGINKDASNINQFWQINHLDIEGKHHCSKDNNLTPQDCWQQIQATKKEEIYLSYSAI